MAATGVRGALTNNWVKKRKLVEEPFGWGKTVDPIAKTMPRGIERFGAQFTLTMPAYNLARLPSHLAIA